MFKYPICLLLVLVPLVSFAQLPDFTSVVKQNGDAVVNISVTQKSPNPIKPPNSQATPNTIPPQMEDLFRHFFKQPDRIQPRDTKSLGSGFIISEDGYVLTNHHVVKDADEIIVKLKDRRELVAKVIGSDERTDIALLQIATHNLPIVKKGSSQQLQVGEWVLAIGSPFGFEQTVTAGIVSAKGRSLPGDNYVSFIQTDVAINRGNSGGPLFNMQGEVVGINSQIYSPSGGYMGLSFAIPIEVAMNVADQLKANGHVSRGWLGVYIQDVTRELAQSFSMDKPHGALVSKVIPDSPSAKAGFRVGDVIIQFDKHKISRSGELPPIVGMTQVGKKINVKIIREGKQKTLKVVIDLLKNEAQTPTRPSPKKTANLLGIVVGATADQSAGVLVESVQPGYAQESGIQAGDIILNINHHPIIGVADFAKIVDNLPINKSIAVLIQRQDSPRYFTLKITPES